MSCLSHIQQEIFIWWWYICLHWDDVIPESKIDVRTKERAMLRWLSLTKRIWCWTKWHYEGFVAHVSKGDFKVKPYLKISNMIYMYKKRRKKKRLVFWAYWNPNIVFPETKWNRIKKKCKAKTKFVKIKNRPKFNNGNRKNSRRRTKIYYHDLLKTKKGEQKGGII